MRKLSAKKPPGLFLLVILLLISGTLAAQNPRGSIQKIDTPAWIKMMDDSNVNFFEIEKNFNDYWKGRVLPLQEDEILDVKNNSERKRGFLGLFRKKASRKELENNNGQQFAFEYKKYQWWKRQVLPYVQPDGRILNKDEQLHIWQHQKQLKIQLKEKQQKKNE